MPVPQAFDILQRLRQRQNLSASDAYDNCLVLGALHGRTSAETDISLVSPSPEQTTQLSVNSDVTVISLDSPSALPCSSVSTSAGVNSKDLQIATIHQNSPAVFFPISSSAPETASTLPAPLPITPVPRPKIFDSSHTPLASVETVRSSDPLILPAISEDHQETAELFIRETIFMMQRGEILPTTIAHPKRKKLGATDVSNRPQKQIKQLCNHEKTKDLNQIPVFISKENLEQSLEKKRKYKRFVLCLL